MLHYLKKSNGVISVFLALIMTSMLSLGTLCIEAVRYQAAKVQLADAAMSSSTSMLGCFDNELFDRYGLLSVDMSRFTQERAKDYMEHNSDSIGVTNSSRLSRLYTVNSVKAEGVYNLTYPSLLKRQVVANAKNNIVPQDYIFNYYNMELFSEDFYERLDYIKSRTATAKQNGGTPNDISSSTQAALQAMFSTFSGYMLYNPKQTVTIDSSEMSLLPSVTGTVESNIPPDDITSINENLSDAVAVVGTEASVLSPNKNIRGYSGETDVSFGTVNGFIGKMLDNSKNAAGNANDTVLLTQRIVEGMNGCFKMLSGDLETNLLLNTYIAHVFSNRNSLTGNYMGPSSGSVSGLTFVSSCAEYVFAGNASEINNQAASADYIVALLYVNNLYSFLKSRPDINSVKSLSAAELWAFYESLCDYELMVNHSVNIPFDKTGLYLNYLSPDAVASAFASNDIGIALTVLGVYNSTEKKYTIIGDNLMRYRDAIAISLWFVPNTQKLMRIADLVQLEMRFRQKNVKKVGATFLMSEQNTFCRMSADAKLNSLLPVLSSASESGLNGIKLKTVKYSGY